MVAAAWEGVPVRRPAVIAFVSIVALSALAVTSSRPCAAWGRKQVKSYTVSGMRKALRAGQLPQRFKLVMQHDGRQREAFVNLPSVYDTKSKTPVIYNLHGFMSNAKQQAMISGLDKLASDRGAIAVHPQGTADSWGIRSWNAFGCCGEAQKQNVDDVGYLTKLHDTLKRELNAHKKGRWTGLSNGAFMSYRLAREMPKSALAGVAPVAGLDVSAVKRPKHNVPVLHTHGTLDLIVPYVPALHYFTQGWTRSARPSARGWALHNKGRGGALRMVDMTTLERVWRSADGTETVSRTVLGGGHLWPGGKSTTTRIVDWLLALD